MRALTVFFALLATLAGAYAGFYVMRELGPDDLTGQYGRGDAVIEGNLMQSENFVRVVEALERELGSDGRLQSLNVELLQADATATVGDRMVRVEIDAGGRSQQRDIGDATPAGTLPVSKLDPRAVDRITKAAMQETGSPVESLALYGGNRQWTANMLRGEPDSFIANLNGKGLRLSGEENPEPAGAESDSLFRAKNLQLVLDAVAKEGTRVLDLTVWPERASVKVEKDGRAVSLNFGYDAELTSRDVSSLSGPRRHDPPQAHRRQGVGTHGQEQVREGPQEREVRDPAAPGRVRGRAAVAPVPARGQRPAVRDREPQGARPVLARARVVNAPWMSTRANGPRWPKTASRPPTMTTARPAAPPATTPPRRPRASTSKPGTRPTRPRSATRTRRRKAKSPTSET